LFKPLLHTTTTFNVIGILEKKKKIALALEAGNVLGMVP
jgi:hypothetical protein